MTSRFAILATIAFIALPVSCKQNPRATAKKSHASTTHARSPLIPTSRPLPTVSGVGLKRPVTLEPGRALWRLKIGMDESSVKKLGVPFKDITRSGSPIRNWKVGVYEVFADKTGHVTSIRARMRDIVMADMNDRRIIYTGKGLDSYEKQLPGCKRDIRLGATHWVCNDGTMRIISTGMGAPEDILLEVSDGK